MTWHRLELSPGSTAIPPFINIKNKKADDPERPSAG
jgi:hypothetical protein